MVLGLNITAKKRFEVCAMLALGLLPTAAAVARVFFLFHALDNSRETDFTCVYSFHISHFSIIGLETN